MLFRISRRCSSCRPSDRIFALSQTAPGDAGRGHADGHAHERPSRAGHLLRPSSPTSPVGPRSVRAGIRPSARQAVADSHCAPERLADRARRAGRVRAALARPATGRRRRLSDAFLPVLAGAWPDARRLPAQRPRTRRTPVPVPTPRPAFPGRPTTARPRLSLPLAGRRAEPTHHQVLHARR